MKLLLDTCTILWAVAAPAELSAAAREALTSSDAEVFVCPMSAAEIACAEERGRIKLSCHWKLWFRDYVKRNAWEVIDIDLPIVEEAYSLPPPFHKDPVDRLLVATARLRGLIIVTADENILSYPHVESVW